MGLFGFMHTNWLTWLYASWAYLALCIQAGLLGCVHTNWLTWLYASWAYLALCIQALQIPKISRTCDFM
jgi:hypothetical protein